MASWLPEAAGDADRHIEWARRFFRAPEPSSRGVCVSFTSDHAAERVRQAYTEQQWARLNFFRMNTDIPAG